MGTVQACHVRVPCWLSSHAPPAPPAPPPSGRLQVWEEGSLSGRRVFVLPAKPAGDRLEAPPALVARIVREQLGVPPPQGEPQLEYDWDLGQLL